MTISVKVCRSDRTTMKTGSPSCNKTDSPKTPGGISKSLLTPCRRVGLSRKWRKSACSPFISPLSTPNSNTPDNKEEKEPRKRRKCSDNEVIDNASPSKIDEFDKQGSCTTPQSNTNDITTTPSRNTQIPRKKSKTLCLSRGNAQEIQQEECIDKTLKLAHKETTNPVIEVSVTDSSQTEKEKKKQDDKVQNIKIEKVSKLSRSNSKSKSKLSLKKSLSKSELIIEESESLKCNSNSVPKERSPNNLTKECIVVIQKKILKGDNPVQSAQESDSELDVPLCDLKKDKDTVTLDLLNDDDFICTKPPAVVKKKSKLSLKGNRSIKESRDEEKSSQSSQDDDEFSSKRTILIRKSYNKVDKPSRAKSTGSITQKDIDDLKARIEMKKKLLLAKSMSVETEELRGLIKKWQKGCQEALMELLELMKKKLPDRPSMDHAEILKLLKIPADLVGYDADNDVFVTPDDKNVLLSSFKL